MAIKSAGISIARMQFLVECRSPAVWHRAANTVRPIMKECGERGIDAPEKVIVRKQLHRGQVLAFFKALPPCLVGMEAYATAHYWVRELTKLGHQFRLMPAKDVKAYVKRNENDAADAGAIFDALRRPTKRFIKVKSAEQQGGLMQHRSAIRARPASVFGPVDSPPWKASRPALRRVRRGEGPDVEDCKGAIE